MGKIFALCLRCLWSGSVAELKRVQVQDTTFLHCPKCDADEFELEEKEE